jgi:hypothetical protein
MARLYALLGILCFLGLSAFAQQDADLAKAVDLAPFVKKASAVLDAKGYAQEKIDEQTIAFSYEGIDLTLEIRQIGYIGTNVIMMIYHRTDYQANLQENKLQFYTYQYALNSANAFRYAVKGYIDTYNEETEEVDESSDAYVMIGADLTINSPESISEALLTDVLNEIQGYLEDFEAGLE